MGEDSEKKKVRQMRYRKRHSERVRNSNRRSTHKARFGNYEKKSHCEQCGVVDVKLDKEVGKKLIIHHIYYTSCEKCAPGKDGRGHCKREDHLMTVCISDHQKIHRNSEWKVLKEMEHMDNHLKSI